MDGISPDSAPFVRSRRALQRLALGFGLAARERADLLWAQLKESERRGDEERAAHYLALLARHDDGRYADLIEGTATLEIVTDPPGARASLRSATSDEVCELGLTPIAPRDLAPGRYLLELEAAGHVRVRRAIRLGRAADLKLVTRLFTAHELGPDAFYLPAGPTPLVGGTFIDNLAVARSPVSVADFLHFFDYLADVDPCRALRYSPGTSASSDPRAPVKVCHEAARYYARWLSRRRGVPYRLLSALEWKKAAEDPMSAGALLGCGEWTVEGKCAGQEASFRLVRDLPSGGGECLLEACIPEIDDANLAG